MGAPGPLQILAQQEQFWANIPPKPQKSYSTVQTHFPFEQNPPLSQIYPQVPQLLASEVTSTHVPLHNVFEVGQAERHDNINKEK